MISFHLLNGERPRHPEPLSCHARAPPRNTRALGAWLAGHVLSHHGQDVTVGHGPFPCGGLGAGGGAGSVSPSLTLLPSRPEEPSTWTGYMGKMFLAASSYLPTQVSDMMNQDRAFATGRLGFSGHRNICTLATYVQPPTPRPRQAETLTISQSVGCPKHANVFKGKPREGSQEGQVKADPCPSTPPHHLAIQHPPTTISQFPSAWSLLLGGQLQAGMEVLTSSFQ